MACFAASDVSMTALPVILIHLPSAIPQTAKLGFSTICRYISLVLLVSK